MKNHRLIAWRPALKDGKEVYLRLEIDTNDLLNWLGEKALKSSGGVSQEATGAVRVKISKDRPR